MTLRALNDLDLVRLLDDDTAGAYVAAGADLLVTSAPYTAAPKDVQVNFLPAA